MWGSAYFAVILSFESFSPFGTLAIRFLLAALLCIAAGLLRRESWPRRSEWWPLAVVGVGMLGLANIFTTWALQSQPSGLVAVFMSLAPMWIVVLSLGYEKPAPRVWTGLALGAAGVWLVLGTNLGNLGHVDGLLAMFFSPVLWALGTVYAKKHTVSRSRFLTLGIQLAFAALLSFCAAPFFGGLLVAPVTFSSAIATVYLGVVASLLAYAAYFYLLSVWPAHRVATSSYLSPVVAVALGVLLLGEPLTSRGVIGMLAVLVAVALIVLKRS